MTVQWSTTLRNALLDQIATTIGTSAKIMVYTGSQPANVAASEAGTLLVEFDLASTYSDAASSGTKNICKTASLPVSATAGASGTAAHYRMYASDGTTCHEQGSITATGGGGDFTIDNTTIVSGQTVQITGFTKTAPGV
jgi:hypothetical protein